MIAVASLLMGCPAETNFFQCVEDSQCGADGQCESSQYCSFPDAECDSGRRYGDEAAPGISGQCVPLESGTGSTSVASTSTSTSGTTIAEDLTSSTTDASTGIGGSVSTTDLESSTSLDGSSSSSSSGGEDCLSLGDQACVQCALESPCSEVNQACNDEPGCAELANCVAVCMTEQCISDCCSETSQSAAEAFFNSVLCIGDVCGIDVGGPVCQ